MPVRSSDQDKSAAAGGKGKPKVAERKRVLKRGSDKELVRAFANKKGNGK